MAWDLKLGVPEYKAGVLSTGPWGLLPEMNCIHIQRFSDSTASMFVINLLAPEFYI